MKTDEFILQIKDLAQQLDLKNKEIIAISEKLKAKGTSVEDDRKLFDTLERLEQEYVSSLVQKLTNIYKIDQDVRREDMEQRIAQKEAKIVQQSTELTSIKLEKELLEKTLEEIKQITTAREMNRVSEIQSLKMNNQQLIEISERREKMILEEIELHKEEVIISDDIFLPAIYSLLNQIFCFCICLHVLLDREASAIVPKTRKRLCHRVQEACF